MARYGRPTSPQRSRGSGGRDRESRRRRLVFFYLALIRSGLTFCNLFI